MTSSLVLAWTKKESSLKDFIKPIWDREKFIVYDSIDTGSLRKPEELHVAISWLKQDPYSMDITSKNGIIQDAVNI